MNLGDLLGCLFEMFLGVRHGWKHRCLTGRKVPVSTPAWTTDLALWSCAFSLWLPGLSLGLLVSFHSQKHKTFQLIGSTVGARLRVTGVRVCVPCDKLASCDAVKVQSEKDNGWIVFPGFPLFPEWHWPAVCYIHTVFWGFQVACGTVSIYMISILHCMF